MDGVRTHGSNFIVGLFGGIIAAIIGSAVWFGITVVTGMHVGYVALGVGALVGLSIRAAGNGRFFIFGVMGAVLTLLSCVTGEFLSTVQLATTPENDFYSVLTHVDWLDMVISLMTQNSPMMYLIYAIGIFEGYHFAIRK